jgi:hypothetical protein
MWFEAGWTAEKIQMLSIFKTNILWPPPPLPHMSSVRLFYIDNQSQFSIPVSYPLYRYLSDQKFINPYQLSFSLASANFELFHKV